MLKNMPPGESIPPVQESFLPTVDAKTATDENIKVESLMLSDSHNALIDVMNRGKELQPETVKSYLAAIEGFVLTKEDMVSLKEHENYTPDTPLIMALYNLREVGKDVNFDTRLTDDRKPKASEHFGVILSVDQMLTKVYSQHLASIQAGGPAILEGNDLKIVEDHVNKLGAEDGYLQWGIGETKYPDWMDDDLKKRLDGDGDEKGLRGNYDEFIERRNVWKNAQTDIEGIDATDADAADKTLKLSSEQISESMKASKGRFLEKIEKALKGVGDKEKVDFDGSQVLVKDLKALKEQLEKEDNSLMDIVLHYARKITEVGKNDESGLEVISNAARSALEPVIQKLPLEQQQAYYKALYKSIGSAGKDKRKLGAGVLSAALSVLGLSGDPIQWIIQEMATAAGGR